MQQAAYHHANALVQKIQTQLQTRDSQMIALLQNIPSLTETSLSSSNEQDYHETTKPVTQAANIITDNTQLEILKLLLHMQSDMKSQHSYGANDTNSSPRNQPNNCPRVLKATKVPDDAKPFRRFKNKYCWTHVACGN